MLNDSKVKMLLGLKRHGGINVQFIRDFDREWSEVVERLQNSKVDLSAIKLAAKETEYQNVRT